MRIISGRAGGIPIQVPKTLTRPTTDRVRESLFSTLGTLVIDAKVLDLFAGSGSLGLESLSRDANSAVFVDQSQASCKCIRKNLAKARLEEKGQIHQWSVSRFLKGTAGNFDLIFADPPYARDEEASEVFNQFIQSPDLSAALSPNGLLILEFWDCSPLGELEQWIVEKEKTYGNTCVSFLRANPEFVCAS